MRARLFLVLSITLAVTIMTGCRSSAASADAASTGSTAGAVSGPPEYNAHFEARKPRKCSAVTHPPNAAEAAALVQCAIDEQSEIHTFLLQNVKVTSISAPRPFNYALDATADSIDVTSKVFDILGSFSIAQCDGVISPDQSGKNCGYADDDTAKGLCWRTSFGSWTCSMRGLHEGAARSKLPGPRTYDEVH